MPLVQRDNIYTFSYRRSACRSCSVAIDIWGSKIPSHTNLTVGALHAIGFVVVFMVLSDITAPKHDDQHVFARFHSTSELESDGVSWPAAPKAMLSMAILVMSIS